MKAEKRLWNIGPATWVTLESILALAAMGAAYKLTPASLPTAGPQHASAGTASILYALILAITAHALGLHNNLNLGARWKTALLTVLSIALAIALTTFALSFFLYEQIGRIIILICASFSLAGGLTLRLFFRRLVSGSPQRVLVWGGGEAEVYLHSLAAKKFSPISIISAVDVSSTDVQEVVVTDTRILSPSELAKCVSYTDRGVQVSTVPAFVERNFYHIPSRFISAEWLFTIDFRRQHPFYHDVKRLTDMALAGLGLVLSAPLLLLAMLAIRLEGRGPIFYSQMRVGLFQRPFRIWKLRTMRTDSEARGPQWAQVSDPRVTRVGRVLRKLRIDELPQFWNIFRGDMAFVGPRPERPEFVEQLAQSIPFYRQRHLITPGLTGWAQICYPYGASEEDAREKLGYDFYYMKKASLLLDLQILLQTVGALARGAR